MDAGGRGTDRRGGGDGAARSHRPPELRPAAHTDFRLQRAPGRPRRSAEGARGGGPRRPQAVGCMGRPRSDPPHRGKAGPTRSVPPSDACRALRPTPSHTSTMGVRLPRSDAYLRRAPPTRARSSSTQGRICASFARGDQRSVIRAPQKVPRSRAHKSANGSVVTELGIGWRHGGLQQIGT